MSDDLVRRLRAAAKHPMMDNNCKADVFDVADAADRIEELEAKLAKGVEASVEAVWAEYTDSVESKWTFRKEHIQNAILRTLAELKGEQP